MSDVDNHRKEADGAERQQVLDARTRAEQLYRFAQAVVEADRLELVFQAALNAIETALGTSSAAILTADSDGTLRFRAWRNLSDSYRLAVEGHSPWPRGALNPAPVLVPDVETDAAMVQFLRLFRAERIGALAFVPLVARHRILGKFMLYYDRPRAFPPHEVEMAQALANHLASVTVRFEVVAKLEETIRYNETFAGILAHDLRNPLSAISAAAQMLLRRHEGEREAKPVGRILSSCERMARMIDQLLDLTRLRVGGGIAIQPTDADLVELCSRVIGEIEIAEPEWIIERTIHGDLAGVWDSDRLLQVISNLVSNAGQHGRRGSPIRLTLDGRSAELVMLEVHNDGAIRPDLLPEIFNPFRGSEHRRSPSRGLGLGLFITKQIVEVHGGTVTVESGEHSGTSFLVQLPRRVSPGQIIAPRPVDPMSR